MIYCLRRFCRFKWRMQLGSNKSSSRRRWGEWCVCRCGASMMALFAAVPRCTCNDVRQAYNSLSDYSHFRISLSGWQASSLTLTLPSCCIVLCRHLFLFTNSASFYYFSYFTWCLHLLVVFAAAAVVSLCHCSLLPGFFCSARQAADANGANHSPALFGDGSCP